MSVGVDAQTVLIMAFSAAPTRMPGIAVGSSMLFACAVAADESISRNAVGEGAEMLLLLKAEEGLDHG